MTRSTTVCARRSVPRPLNSSSTKVVSGPRNGTPPPAPRSRAITIGAHCRWPITPPARYTSSNRIATPRTKSCPWGPRQEGTERVRTSYNGAVEATIGTLPFGDGYSVTGTSTDPYSYALLDYDSETETDHAQFRQLYTATGRWMSPYPYMGSYDALNPQSMNQYAYVLDNPLAITDSLGLECDIDLGCNDSSPDAGSPCGFWCTIWNYLAGDGSPNPYGDVPFWGAGTGQVPIVAPQIQVGGGGGGAPSNGRNCSVGPASAGQYAAASGQVAKMTAGFFSGLGPDQYTFGSDSAVSQVMAQSGQFQDVLNQYYMSGTTSNWQGFGAAGFVEAGANPVAQFLGSFGWSIAPTAGGINVTITNVTSFHSLMLDKGPAYERFPMTVPTGPSGFATITSPMGNVGQTITIKAVCR